MAQCSYGLATEIEGGSVKFPRNIVKVRVYVFLYLHFWNLYLGWKLQDEKRPSNSFKPMCRLDSSIDHFFRLQLPWSPCLRRPWILVFKVHMLAVLRAIKWDFPKGCFSWSVVLVNLFPDSKLKKMYHFTVDTIEFHGSFQLEPL